MTINSERGKEMLSYLPEYYADSRVMQTLLETEGKEFDSLNLALNDEVSGNGILQQFFVPTATWGLDIWEQELGLPVSPDQPVSERRDKIISRIRGFGTATIGITKKVAESYDKGQINVIEDFQRYNIILRFVDTAGVPPNIDDLKAAVRTVVPAHIEINYEYNYMLWMDLDELNWTWEHLDSLNLTWDELEVYQ